LQIRNAVQAGEVGEDTVIERCRREFVDAGGLISYGANYSDQLQRAAALVDKILKGAKPAEIPVEVNAKIEFVINLKAAKALGLTVPLAMTARADEVIE